jgi:hypothetical protein
MLTRARNALLDDAPAEIGIDQALLRTIYGFQERPRRDLFFASKACKPRIPENSHPTSPTRG